MSSLIHTYHSTQLWKCFAVKWKGLIIHNMPMKNIKLSIWHSILWKKKGTQYASEMKSNSPTYNNSRQSGGSVAKWSGHWTCNLVILSSSCPPCYSLGFILVCPEFNSLAVLFTSFSQIVCLPPVGVLKHFNVCLLKMFQFVCCGPEIPIGRLSIKYTSSISSIHDSLRWRANTWNISFKFLLIIPNCPWYKYLFFFEMCKTNTI